MDSCYVGAHETNSYEEQWQTWKAGLHYPEISSAHLSQDLSSRRDLIKATGTPRVVHA